MFVDNDVVDGLEYTYSVVSYDMGVEPPYDITYIDIGNGQYVYHDSQKYNEIVNKLSDIHQMYKSITFGGKMTH